MKNCAECNKRMQKLLSGQHNCAITYVRLEKFLNKALFHAVKSSAINGNDPAIEDRIQLLEHILIMLKGAK